MQQIRIAHYLLALVATVFVSACSEGDDVLPTAGASATSEDVCNSAPVRGFGFDQYGGWKGIERAASGRFRVERVDGVWWFITPDGHALFSNGPTGIDPIGDTVGNTSRAPYRDGLLAKNGSIEAWATNTQRRLCMLGIRSLGGWMGAADYDRFNRVPYAVNVDFYQVMPRIRGGAGFKPFHDVFDPHAGELAQGIAAEGGLLQRCARDAWCIGAYVENEVPYLPSLINGGGHLDSYLGLMAGAPGKVAVQEFFAQRYAGNVETFNVTWDTQLASFADMQQLRGLGTCPLTLGYDDDLCYFDEPPARLEDRLAFEAHVAGTIAQLANSVLRGLNAAMLNLGPRLVVGPAAPAVLRALAGPVDVMSVNNYDVSGLIGAALSPVQRQKLAALGLLSFDPFERLQQLTEITDKPVLITEWFYRRARVGVTTFPPHGILPEVPDATAQAEAYRGYMEGILGLPSVVGEHWFQWPDQPVEGRSDGENQIIGIVDINDELNQPLAETMAAVNASIIERRTALRVP